MEPTCPELCEDSGCNSCIENSGLTVQCIPDVVNEDGTVSQAPFLILPPLERFAIVPQVTQSPQKRLGAPAGLGGTNYEFIQACRDQIQVNFTAQFELCRENLINCYLPNNHCFYVKWHWDAREIGTAESSGFCLKARVQYDQTWNLINNDNNPTYIGLTFRGIGLVVPFGFSCSRIPQTEYVPGLEEDNGVIGNGWDGGLPGIAAANGSFTGCATAA